MITGHKYFDDIQGMLQTALSGVTAYTYRQYRNTGMVYPHIAQSDIFSMTYQFSHRKKLGENVESVHIHYIPIASANGDILIEYAWGWYNYEDTIPDTLPNTGSKIISLVTTDQYKLKITPLIEDITPPAEEDYSSILMVRLTRATPAGTNWGASNEIALVYLDAHMPVDRYGSYYEYSDTI